MSQGTTKRSDIITLKKELEAELRAILSYWIDHTQDKDKGGFVGARDHYNRLVPGAEKGAVLNARILWTFSAAYNFTQNPGYLNIANRAYHYLVDRFIDPINGGLYWSLNEDGKVANSRKQIYAQGFGIYGFSEYYKATQNKEALQHATGLFELIEKHSYDHDHGGYIEALSENWSPLEDMRLSSKDANEPKSMNTHLHILEPYTNLYRVWPDEQLKKKMDDLIRVFINHIINKKTSHFQLFFDYDWTVRSGIISFGHDIEGAWLLAEAAYELADDKLIAEVEDISLKMVDAVLAEGMANDGSVCYEQENKHLDTDKHWWPQAEAMVGLVYAWKISGDKNYLEMMNKTWHFIQTHLIDNKNGEWFWSVDNNGVPTTNNDKAGFWKCPYHNSRALIEVIKNLN
ncbi:AGE family epimerase/isomerase [Sunxiuqinia indica]|uniref:AGE family epimerase/isomerase n=1 Tax=Sunxiuqinia indica TaxID=2692584 RepID=UPI00135ABBD5|nr:AGE family epimerase/isomerase [Sunxiuqinia indica]